MRLGPLRSKNAAFCVCVLKPTKVVVVVVAICVRVVIVAVVIVAVVVAAACCHEPFSEVPLISILCLFFFWGGGGCSSFAMQDSNMTPLWLALGYMVGGHDDLLNPGLLLWCCLVSASHPNILLSSP